MLNKKTKIYGIKKRKVYMLNEKMGFNIRFSNFNLIERKRIKLQKLLKKQRQGSALRTFNYKNIRFLKDNRSYRGLRHRYNLPVRGQRTHTNAKTSKKKRFKRFQKTSKR